MIPGGFEYVKHTNIVGWRHDAHVLAAQDFLKNSEKRADLEAKIEEQQAEIERLKREVQRLKSREEFEKLNRAQAERESLAL